MEAPSGDDWREMGCTMAGERARPAGPGAVTNKDMVGFAPCH